MEENSNQDKKKMIITLVVGIVTLLILVIGATYAYFQVNTTNNNTNSNVTVKTGKPGTATLKPGVGDLHIILNNVDMSETNKGIEYYADDTKNYVDNEPEGKHTISTVEITDGDSDVAYKCTVSVEVNLTTDAGSMGEALQKGDVLLNIEGQEIDLYNVKETNPTTVNLSFSMYGNGTKEIKAYAKLINKNESQNYLSGRQLKVNIASKNLDCDAYEPNPKIAFLRSKDTKGYLSPTIQGDMYRYQGTGDVPNWICFGTTENCGTSDDLIKKYMYRIIGITEEGKMKLIKETFVEEGTVTGFAWNDEYQISGSGVDACPNGICPEWNEADLFQRINGTANGTIAGRGNNDDGVDNDTDIFVDSEEYDYLRSGDNINGGTSASTWYNLISVHEWMYGDTIESTYNGDIAYQIETGQRKTTHYAQQPAGSKTVVSESYKWPTTNKVTAKISLMYIHDYIYAYPGGNPGNYSTAKNAWIFYQKDGYNTSTSFEWLSTRWGVYNVGYAQVATRDLDNAGGVSVFNSLSGCGVRPVFYLSSAAKIKDGGEGTKTNPFILDVQE